MTSTPFNVGLRDGHRMSSRILRPPGGGHTQLFGEIDESQNLKNQAKPIPETVAETGQEEQPTAELNGASKSETKENEIEQGGPPVQEMAKEQGSAPVPATEPAPDAEPAPRLQGVPRRSRVPPGGYSSGLW